MEIKTNKQSGFTLVEIMLVIAIIGAVSAFSSPIYKSFLDNSAAGSEESVVAQSIRRAQVLAQGVEGDSRWGVRIQNGSVVVFKGNDFTSRDTNFDEYFETLQNISVSGLQEVIFERFSGIPLQVGTITLTGQGGLEKKLIINSKGIIE